MRTCDVAVVGGGPAGAACAGALRAAGADVVVVDAAHFPRDKVCAGWVAPGVFAALDIDPGEYRASGHTLQPIRRITVTIEGEQGGTTIDYPDAVGYGVRRREFDTFLLRHCGAPAIEGTRVRQIRREGRGWRLDDTVSAGCLVGAGGQFCPVAAWLRSAAPAPIDDVSTVVAREIEAAWSPPERAGAPAWPHLWFSRDLDGYGWVFPKGEFVNIGLGRRSADGFADAVDTFARRLPGAGVPDRLLDWHRWHGHAYRLRGSRRSLGGERLVLAGDAAGLAFRESGEGIGPAVESGLLAAALIAGTRGEPTANDIEGYARRAGARDQYTPWPLPGSLVRPLLHVAPLVRLAMDRWFLRRGQRGVEAA